MSEANAGAAGNGAAGDGAAGDGAAGDGAGGDGAANNGAGGDGAGSAGSGGAAGSDSGGGSAGAAAGSTGAGGTESVAPDADVIALDGAIVGRPCALRRNGELWCLDTLSAEAGAFALLGIFPGSVTVVRGNQVTCLLNEDGGVQCLGNGGVGDGTADPRTEPTPVLGVDDAVHVDTWVGHTCIVHETGGVSCWGQNDFSQIEAGGEPVYLEPHAIAGITTAVQVATSRLGTCALLADGSVSCWADNFGATPTPIAGVSDGIAITAGHFHFCVRTAAGSVSCFGGERAGLEVQVPSPISDAAEAIAFHSETCYRSTDGAVSCWGAVGQPGQTVAPPLEPVVGLDDAVLLANHCAVRSSGSIVCWQNRTELIEITPGFE